MQRIAFYLPSFSGGGAERNSCLIASEMARRGNSVLVIVDRDSGPNRELLNEAVEVRCLSGNNFDHIRQLKRLLHNWNAEVVFARLGVCPIVAATAQLGFGTKWKTVISFHNPYDPGTSLGVRACWWGTRLISRMTHATFGVSHDITNSLVREYGAPRSKSYTIHNPVDIDWVVEAQTAPSPATFPTENPFILSVGRLVDQKGYPDLINAFAKIKDQITEDLVILGEGPNEPLLRKQIEEQQLTNRVFLFGYCPNPFPIYAKARLFVLASHWEGFGNVIVEALACGTPVVATNCPGGPKDILADGKFGTLAAPKNPTALAEAILQSLNTPVDRDALRERARDFHLSTITDRYLALTKAPPPAPGDI